MAKVIGYKGHLGITAIADDYVAGGKLKLEDFRSGLLNNPFEDGQLGFVYELKRCSFNQEALDLLKTIKKSQDDIGAVDLFRESFYWIGSPRAIFFPNDLKERLGSSSYDSNLLDDIEPSFTEIPEDFKQFIDSL